MEIMTKYFGELSFDENEILNFENGLFGFESFKKFSLIRFDNENGNILCLQSLEESQLAFTIINPFAFLQDYTPKLNEEVLKHLGLDDEKSDFSSHGFCHGARYGRLRQHNRQHR